MISSETWWPYSRDMTGYLLGCAFVATLVAFSFPLSILSSGPRNGDSGAVVVIRGCADLDAIDKIEWCDDEAGASGSVEGRAIQGDTVQVGEQVRGGLAKVAGGDVRVYGSRLT